MILLATDLDGTLVGDEKAAQGLLSKLATLRRQNRLKLVYATGRSLDRYREAQRREGLPDPDGLIASAGTEIYLGSSYQPLEQWQQMFASGWGRSEILACASQVEGLELQMESEQRPFKLSFIGHELSDEDIKTFQADLAKVSSVAELLVSHGGEYIDIMPRGSDKGQAVRYLAKYGDIDPEDVICAGDSANDVAMLAAAKAIVVGNAYGEVKQWFVEHPTSPVYFAKASYAAGIAEGLTHYLGQGWREL